VKNETLLTVRLSNQSVRIMTAMLGEAGLESAAVFRAAGLAPALADDPDGEISGAEELRFQQAFANATRHLPGLWLRTGLRYRLMSYGPLGLAVLAASNVAEGLRVLDAFQALTFSLMNYRVRGDGGAPVALSADDSLAPPDLREFLQERALGSVTMFLNDMRQRAFPFERIESVLDRPAGWLGCEALLGVPVMFGAAVTQWVFKPGAGAEPLPMSSPLLEETYQRMCARLIGNAEVTDPFVSRLYGLLVRSHRGFPSAVTVAPQLAVSERTLHRKLAARGTSFGAILDQVREQRARFMLERSALSVEQIGDILGFSETASFSRAFKRWTGTSPLTFRKTMPGKLEAVAN